MILGVLPGTTMTWLLGLAVAVVVILRKVSRACSAASTSQLPLPPGPRGLRALASLLRAVRSSSFHLEIPSWGRKGSPITCCHCLGITVVSINSPDLVREALSHSQAQGQGLDDRPATFIGQFLFYGPKDIAMASLSPAWYVQRKLFHSSLRLYGDGVYRFESTVQGELSFLIEQLDHTMEQDVCIEDYMSATLLNILTILMTGERPSPDSDVPQAMRSLDRRVSAMGTPSVDLVLRICPLLRHVPGWFRTQCRLAKADRDRLLGALLADAKSTLSTDRPRGIVDVLLLEQESSGMSDDHIRGLILDIVVGGYVTTLSSFLSTVLVLLNLPQVARTIQQEVDRHVGQRKPTVDDRKNLHYTEATLLEMLRYMSFFPIGLPHSCTQETRVAGYLIPKHAVVILNQWECGRDPNAWADPDQFRPERFLDKQGHLLPANHATRRNLLPFGIGRRACPGETFARTRLFLLVTTLLQHFDVLPPTSGHVIPLDNIPWLVGAVLLPPAFHCRFVRRL